MLLVDTQWTLLLAEQQHGGGMPVSQVPWIALAVSVLALYLAYNNYRLSHTVVVQVIHCESGGTVSVDEGSYEYFTIYLRNIGIPLHDIGMSLRFQPPSTGGSATLPLRSRENEARRNGQFAKGMITEFTFRSDRLDRTDLAILQSLRDTREQNARFVLHSNGYRAWEYRLDKRRWLKRRWNRIASTFSNLVRTQRAVAPEGHDIISMWPHIPRFLLPAAYLEQFLDWIRRTNVPRTP